MNEANTTIMPQKNLWSRRGARRCLAFFLALLMGFTLVTTPAEAFSFKGLFKKVSNAITQTVKKVSNLVDRSDTKTINSYAELNSFVSSLFGPSDITANLGSDIYIPSNKRIVPVMRNLTLNLNGHTIYSDNPEYAIFISYGRKVTINGSGSIVQRVNNSQGIIYMSSGDAKINNVTFRKSGSASRVTGLYATGAIGDPEITFDNVTFDGMTAGMNIQAGARVIMNNSQIKNTQGDAVYMPSNWFNKQSTLTMSNTTVKYFKGNGISVEANAKATLNNVTITGGTTRNRYGILTGKSYSGKLAQIELKGNSRVYSNAGGNIGVYRKDNVSGHIPVTIDTLSSYNQYSFTVVDGLDETNPTTVARMTNAFSGNIRNYSVKSDISRYMVRGENNNQWIQVQNPPEQCTVSVATGWVGGKALNTEKDANYASVSLNDGTEPAVVKYATRMTLSTINNNPERYKFVGWRKYVGGVAQGDIISTEPICQVDVIDEFVTYKAEYQYMQYTITARNNGKGTVTGSGTYYVDDVVTLKATAAASETVSGSTKTYAFSRWNDGNTEATRTITVSKSEVYVATFKKTGQTTGTLYLGLKEVTESEVPEGNLLLVYVGEGFEGNRMETGAGANIGVTGLPEGSAKMSLSKPSVVPGSPVTDPKPYNSAQNSGYSGSGANYYGYQESSLAPPTSSSPVYWTQAASDFDTCNPGFLKRTTVKGKDCWLYWCGAGGIQAAGPYVLYRYDSEIQFSMSSVRITMNPDFKPSKAGNTIDASSIVAVATATNGTEYVLGGLKFGGESLGLDNLINYREGDKSIALELDGITCDYDFPEAIINGKQYTKLTEALKEASANETKETIEIVGPGVDEIDVETPVDLKSGDIIKGYDKEQVTALSESSIGVDKDGTIRLTQGKLKVNPDSENATVGVKDAFATTDKEIIVTTADGGRDSVIIPSSPETTLQISPDNNPEHIVTITGAGGDGAEYGFDHMPSYAGENVDIKKGTEYTVYVPNEEGSATPIKTSKNNAGNTTITEGSNGNPTITSDSEGDKVTVGDKTYTTGGKGTTKYQVDPNPDAVPSVVLEEGEIGIPVDTTIKVGDTIIKNTGSTTDGETTGTNPVQISANGEIGIPNGAGITIDDVRIEVPAKTPLNGNTTVVLDEQGEPTIHTSGGSEVKLVVDGEETIYQVGDYDAKLSIGKDGTPVIEDGEILLKPGRVIKDRLGNEYRCPEDAEDGITIMTTPLVYDTDEAGNPVLVGGGDMSFIIPEGQSIQCKPKGSSQYLDFENPGDGSGFFNLDPNKASEGIQADSEMGLASGKQISLKAGDKSIDIEAPESGNTGNILIDGSTGSVTLTNAGDKVIIDGQEYIVKEANTVLVVDENGISLSKGSVSPVKAAPVVTNGVKIAGNSANANPIEIVAGKPGATEDAPYQNTVIKTTGKTEFGITPTGKESGGITFVSDAGENQYEVELDGTLKLSAGDTITRKQGTQSVAIKAPADADIALKPLAKPSAAEIADADGDVTPVGGLLIEVPTGSAITIGGKTYKESTVASEETEEYTSPMQLVLDEKGKVVLYSGTLELGKDTDISLYDIENKLATFRNTSQDDQSIQVTNPGVVTMPMGSSIAMGAGKNTVEYTATKETQLVYTPSISMLRKGGVELNPGEKILVSDMIVKNSSKTGDVSVTRKETLNSEGEYEYEGTIRVQNGGSFEISAPGSDKSVSYRSNIEGSGESEFTVTKDGSILLPQNAIVELKNTAGESTQIQAGVEGIESIATPDSAMMAIPEGGFIVVNDVKYTNAGSEHLVLSVDHDGNVILVQGEVELSEGAIIYVKNEDDALVPIKNTTTSEEGEESIIKVGYAGVTVDEDEEVPTTYPRVDVSVPVGSSISIGDNQYEAVKAAGGDSNVKISMDIETAAGSETGEGNISADRILLESGTVNLGAESAITVKNPDAGATGSQIVLENIGKENAKPVVVGSDATVELSTGSAVSVNGATTIQVPEEETGDDYKVVVDLNGTGGKLELEMQQADPEKAGVPTGEGKKVIINGGTYESKEDGKNLSLTVDTGKNDQVSLSGSSTSVKLSDGASVVVGDTMVTATSDKEITVTETNSGGETVPKVDIPAGVEANFQNLSDNRNINVKVPEKNSGTETEADNQEFTVDADGNISTNLKKDETVVIGGIEYTGTSESETNNTIKVDGTTGDLLDKPEGAAPIVSIDPTRFDKDNYVYTLKAGENILVNGVTYQVAEGSELQLLGNPNGNPIVVLQNAEDAVLIGETVYTAQNANTKFVLDDSNRITLQDNGAANPASNSSLKFSGTAVRSVNGISYKGSQELDSYAVSYNAGGCYVSVANGSKILTNMPNGSTIYLEGYGAIETTDETNQEKTENFNGPIPIRMNGSGGSLYLDKSREDSMDTVYVQPLGSKVMKPQYDPATNQIISLSIDQKGGGYIPDIGDKNKEEAEEKEITNITITGGKENENIEIPISVEKDKVIIDTISAEIVEKLVGTEQNEKLVIIDCTQTNKTTIVFDISTMENMVEKSVQIQIKTSGAEVLIDSQATEAIFNQAKGETIEIKVSDAEGDILNEAQMETVKNYSTEAYLEAYVESNGVRIHDFAGGKVRIGIPWKIPEGRKAVYYHIYFLDDKGDMHIYDTSYEEGKLYFETEHFSEYVVVYDDNFLNITLVNQIPLLTEITKISNATVKLEWKAVDEADTYVIYAAKCNTKNKQYKLKKVATVKQGKTSYVLRGLTSATNYKIQVRALRDGEVLKKSLVLHAITKGGAYNNASDIKILQSSIAMKADKKKTLKIKYVSNKKSLSHGGIVRFMSSNTEVASVNKQGEVLGKKAGSCYIYAFLNTGEYAAVKVTVK